jgi:hypothetical protein
MREDVSMRPPSRMTDERRQQLERLLSKPGALTGTEQGLVRALSQGESGDLAEQVRARLDGAGTSSGRLDAEFARQLGEKVGKNVARFMDERT